MCDKMEDLGCLPNGCHLFCKPNVVGGYTYYGDEIGGGVMVWDTCLVDESTLLTAIVCEHHRKYMEQMTAKGWQPNLEIEIERMAATGGSFITPKLYNHVVMGDVISLCEDECKILGDIPKGEYIVEDAKDHGGWMVMARKLDATGKYCADNPMVQFYQCPGYSCSLSLVKVVGRMKRIFV